VKVLDRFLPKAVELLADIFLNSIFDPAEIEKERKVILQEINMVEDNPDDCIHDLFVRNFWKDHPLGMSILGSSESVGSLDRDAIIAFKNEKYLANEIIIAAAGNVVEEDLVGLLNKLFVQVPAGAAAALCSLPAYEKRLEIIERDIEQVHFCLGTSALPQNHPQRHEGHLLNTVLGGSMSSRLFQEIREKLGLAYSVYSYVSSYTDAGSMVIYAGTSPAHVEEVLDIVLRELKRLKTEPVPEIELNYAREQIKGNLLLSLESSDSRMTKLAKNEIYFGRNVTIEEIMASLDVVTSAGLLQLSNELFNDAHFTLELMGRVAGSGLVLDRVKL
jgi:predicted Zn-dependent peptidase